MAKITVAGPTHSKPVSSTVDGDALKMSVAEPVLDPSVVAADPAVQERGGNLDVKSTVPSQSVLGTAAELSVFDAHGKAMPFKDLYKADPGRTRKVLIIFIRHFLCGVRQLSLSLPEGIRLTSIARIVKNTYAH